MYCLLVVGSDDTHDGTAPVFVHQSKWQLDMLHRYGCSVCLIDATYNTTLYGMPFFMLCVLTNSGYVVVGTFLSTDEQAASIAAGLRIFSQRCPAWRPKYVMSDFSEAQISAAESVFPGNFNYTVSQTKVHLLHFADNCGKYYSVLITFVKNIPQ